MDDVYDQRRIVPGSRASLYYEAELARVKVFSGDGSEILREKGMHVQGERRGYSDRVMERYLRGEDV